MALSRDNRAERVARIEWLLEETRTRTESIAAHIQNVTRVIEKASKLAKANLDSAKQRRPDRPSKKQGR